jgi:hypothetical protein
VCHLSKILLKNDHSSLKSTKIVDAPKKQNTREKRQQRARGFNQWNLRLRAAGQHLAASSLPDEFIGRKIIFAESEWIYWSVLLQLLLSLAYICERESRAGCLPYWIFHLIGLRAAASAASSD